MDEVISIRLTATDSSEWRRQMALAAAAAAAADNWHLIVACVICDVGHDYRLAFFSSRLFHWYVFIYFPILIPPPPVLLIVVIWTEGGATTTPPSSLVLIVWGWFYGGGCHLGRWFTCSHQTQLRINNEIPKLLRIHFRSNGLTSGFPEFSLTSGFSKMTTRSWNTSIWSNGLYFRFDRIHFRMGT